MEDFAHADALFGLASSPEKISPVERLLNEFEAHEAKEDRALEVYKASARDARCMRLTCDRSL